MREGIKQELLCGSLCIGLPVLYELLYQILILENGAGTVPMICFAILMGETVYVATGWLPEIPGKIVYCVGNGLLCLYFMIQVVYYDVFEVFFSFSSLFAVGTDIMDFKGTIWNAIIANAGNLLVYVLFLSGFCIFFCIKCDLDKKSRKQRLFQLLGWGMCFLLFFVSLLPEREKENSPYQLYLEDWNETLGARKLGIMVLAQKDMLRLVTGGNRTDELENIIILERTIVQTPVPTESVQRVSEVMEEQTVPEITLTPTPTPIDTSPNVWNIDFAALAAEEKREEVKILHEYFAGEEYTLKNEYTGMFEGYNLIMITAEGFAPYAMQEELTPTLLKMSREGFVFKNYYAPLWMTSTIDGEFVNCTGLIPDRQFSLRRMIGHDMRLCLGNMFGKLGYLTNAYHNHWYAYYDRDKTHPSMGYDYKGRGNGLDVMEQWPESDLEMMELSLPEYVGEEPFHVYYMTVSGHMEYNFGGNRMAANHRDVVEDLPYSDQAKAYLACNYELELAMRYLIEQLEEAGVAEKTVIAIATDHYPYGLDKATIEELMGHEVENSLELYKSTWILWSPSMETPVEVEKCCSSIDIVPTLANLFGLSYDSRLYMGKDALSDSEGLVVFQDKSFITDRIIYHAADGTVTRLSEEELSEGYVENRKQVVKNRFAVSKGIIDLDYYSYLPWENLTN